MYRLCHTAVSCVLQAASKTTDSQNGISPTDRLSTEAAFTYVGLDFFEPWTVTSRRTRVEEVNNKRLAVLLTCMSIRARHIEGIKSTDTSSFINAFRRLFALRGPVKLLRSDYGTYFDGACLKWGVTSNNVATAKAVTYISDNTCTWLFNPPPSSDMAEFGKGLSESLVASSASCC